MFTNAGWHMFSSRSIDLTAQQRESGLTRREGVATRWMRGRVARTASEAKPTCSGRAAEGYDGQVPAAGDVVDLHVEAVAGLSGDEHLRPCAG